MHMPVIQVENPGNVIQISGLKYVRLKKKISIRELAKRIGKDEKLIRLLESGRIASPETLKILCEELSIDENEINKLVSVNQNELTTLQKELLSLIYSAAAQEKKRGRLRLRCENILSDKINNVLSSRWNAKDLCIF